MRELKKLSYDEVLTVLEGVKPNGEGIKALCPAHADNKESLTMKRGSNGEAVCNCFAGCTPSDIFSAIYKRIGRTFEFTEEPEKPKKVAEYKYINEAGEIVNIKVRMSNKNFYFKKRFDNQRSPLPLFRLKEVIERNPVFLVEGEKDTLTLVNRGFGATNDKKTDGFTSDNVKKYLSGKDIIVLPDNDEAGFKYAREAADMCFGIANSIKFVDLRTLWSDMPEKADVTDYIVIHKGTVEQIIEKANSLEEYRPTKKEAHVEHDEQIKQDADEEQTIRNNHPHSVIWKNVEGYSLNSKNQIVYIKNEDERIPICHGSIVITEVIYNNDGLEDNILFKCEGVTDSGERLSVVTIPVDEFDSLKWITKKWGCSIIPFGTQSTVQRLLCGIKLTGRNAPITFQKCHTGFVNDEKGKPIAYLHAGGSIGNQDLRSELDFRLNQYKLAGCSATPEEKREAFKASLSLLQAHRESITFPLLSFAYMPPLMQINKEVNGESGFLLYLRGKTQNGKSTLAALTMSHFGNFTSTTPPTSFASTWANNEKMSFLLKDSILWVDDFIPKDNKQAQSIQNEQFSKMSRAAGDRAFRGRLNSNSDFMKVQNIPRCLYLVTGEDQPKLSQSGLARIFTIDVKDFRKEAHDISSLRTASSNGLLSQAMSDYICYIIENYEAIKRVFEGIYKKVISGIGSTIGENRLSIQATLLIVSFDMWLYYALKSNLLDKATAEELSSKNRKIIMGLANKISNEIKESDPAEKFISTLSSMISNREVELRDIHFGDNDNELFDEKLHRIGWFDEEYYYLDKEKAYSAVKLKLESVDDFIGITMNSLFGQMMDSGLIEGDKNSYAKVKNINGKNKRVLYIRRTVLEPK